MIYPFEQLSKLDLAYIAVLLDNNEVVNGLGKSIRVCDVITAWDAALKAFCSHVIDESFPDEYSLYVPDFWHIAYGRAKCLTKEQGDSLWLSACTVHDLMKPLIAAQVVTRVAATAGGTTYIWDTNGPT